MTLCALRPTHQSVVLMSGDRKTVYRVATRDVEVHEATREP